MMADQANRVIREAIQADGDRCVIRAHEAIDASNPQMATRWYLAASAAYRAVAAVNMAIVDVEAAVKRAAGATGVAPCRTLT